MNCDVFRNSVTEYFEGALSPLAAETLNEHRIECDQCEAFLTQIRLIMDALGGLNRGNQVESMQPELLGAFRRWASSVAHRDSVAEDDLCELLELSEFQFLRETSGTPMKRLEVMRNRALEEALRMGIREPQEALKFARLGLWISKRLHKESDEAISADRLSYSWAVLGNASRICSDFPAAREAFKRAEILLEEGTGSGECKADVLQLKASFLACCGQDSEALGCIDEAIHLFEKQGRTHQVGKALITKGTLMGPYGDSNLSAEILRRGLARIDEENDPRLALVARHNLIHSLFESGERQEALSILEDTRASHRALNNPVDLIRFQWLEGKIALDLEDLGAAESSFVEAKRYFVEQGMAYDAALVSLDLAMVYLKRARIAELKVLAAEMVTIFRALGIPREVLAALAFFNKALEIEQTATVGLLQELLETLEKTRQREECRPQLGVSN